MSRTRIVLVVALVWGADLAGAWLLPDRHQIVLNGITVVASTALLGRWIERRAQARAQAAIFERDQREAALIATIERLTGGKQTGPMPRLRDAA